MIVYILLPKCIHSDHNVFFNILKNVVHKVGRAKLTDHFIDSAFKEGMAGKCEVDLNAVGTWSVHSSRQDKISQSRLLGRWAIRNYPTFGNILFGDSWQTIDSPSDIADEVDNVVFTKMKCVLVELNVVESTLPNLKHFVQVPINEISVENMSSISQKTNSFDIKDDCLAKCWMSLKHGKWLMNKEIETPSTSKRARLNSKCLSMHPYDNYNPISLARKQAHGRDMKKQPHSQSARAKDSLMDVDCNEVTPLDLTKKQSYDLRSMEQAQLNLGRLNETCLDSELNDGELSDNNATFTRKPTTNEELRERVTVLQDQLLIALQRELDQKNSQLDERNKLLLETQKTVVVLEHELLGKSLPIGDLQKQLDEKNNSLSESQRSIDALKDKNAELSMMETKLRSDLIAKNEALAAIEESKNNLTQQLATQIESLTALQDVIDELKSEKISLTAIEKALRLELTEKNESLAAIEESNLNLQRQLTTKTELVAELHESINVLQNENTSLNGIQKALHSELIAKKESLAGIEESNKNLNQQLATKIELLTALQDVIGELKSEKISLAAIEKTLRLELTEKNDSLVEIEGSNLNLQRQVATSSELVVELNKSINVLQNENTSLNRIEATLRSELTAKNESLIEIHEKNRSLKLELAEKNKSLSDLSKLKPEIQKTIHSLELQINQKNISLTELESSNHYLRLELTRMNASLSELPSSTAIMSESTTFEEMFVVNPVWQPEQPNAAQLLPTLSQESKMTEQAFEETAEIAKQTSQPGQDFVTTDEVVKACRKKLLDLQFGWIKFTKNEKFKPGFLHPSDADGTERAQEIDSEGYPSNEIRPFFQFEKDVAPARKLPAQIKKLKLLNKKFKFEFS